jgi:hypothetical protein
MSSHKVKKYMKKIKLPKRYNQKQLTVFAVAFALIGLATLFIARAATTVANIEVESGNVTGAATAFGGDQTASSQGYVKFGAQRQHSYVYAYGGHPGIMPQWHQHGAVSA